MDPRLRDALESQGKLILLPANADPDSVGAACGLALALGATVRETQGVSASGARIAADADVPIVSDALPERHPVTILVDGSTRIKFGPLAARVEAPVVIDHHAPTGDFGPRAVLCVDETRRSTCEIVLDLVLELERPLPPAAAQALLSGLVADTQRFRYADVRSFRAAVELLERGAKIEASLSILDDRPEEMAQRMARLKAAARACVEEHEGFLLATSVVGSFESSAADGLVLLGADVAFVATTRGDEVRVSGRARKAVASRIHLGRLMAQTAGSIPGGACEGGGHSGAAGLNGRASSETALSVCLAAARKALSKPLASLAEKA